MNVKVGKKVTIKVMATLVAKVTYKSSNKKIVTVMDKGVVKGVKQGNDHGKGERKDRKS